MTDAASLAGSGQSIHTSGSEGLYGFMTIEQQNTYEARRIAEVERQENELRQMGLLRDQLGRLHTAQQGGRPPQIAPLQNTPQQIAPPQNPPQLIAPLQNLPSQIIVLPHAHGGPVQQHLTMGLATQEDSEFNKPSPPTSEEIELRRRFRREHSQRDVLRRTAEIGETTMHRNVRTYYAHIDEVVRIVQACVLGDNEERARLHDFWRDLRGQNDRHWMRRYIEKELKNNASLDALLDALDEITRAETGEVPLDCLVGLFTQATSANNFIKILDPEDLRKEKEAALKRKRDEFNRKIIRLSVGKREAFLIKYYLNLNSTQVDDITAVWSWIYQLQEEDVHLGNKYGSALDTAIRASMESYQDALCMAYSDDDFATFTTIAPTNQNNGESDTRQSRHRSSDQNTGIPLHSDSDIDVDDDVLLPGRDYHMEIPLHSDSDMDIDDEIDHTNSHNDNINNDTTNTVKGLTCIPHQLNITSRALAYSHITDLLKRYPDHAKFHTTKTHFDTINKTKLPLCPWHARSTPNQNQISRHLQNMACNWNLLTATESFENLRRAENYLFVPTRIMRGTGFWPETDNMDMRNWDLGLLAALEELSKVQIDPRAAVELVRTANKRRWASERGEGMTWMIERDVRVAIEWALSEDGAPPSSDSFSSGHTEQGDGQDETGEEQRDGPSDEPQGGQEPNMGSSPLNSKGQDPDDNDPKDVTAPYSDDIYGISPTEIGSSPPQLESVNYHLNDENLVGSDKYCQRVQNEARQNGFDYTHMVATALGQRAAQEDPRHIGGSDALNILSGPTPPVNHHLNMENLVGTEEWYLRNNQNNTLQQDDENDYPTEPNTPKYCQQSDGNATQPNTPKTLIRVNYHAGPGFGNDGYEPDGQSAFNVHEADSSALHRRPSDNSVHTPPASSTNVAAAGVSHHTTTSRKRKKSWGSKAYRPSHHIKKRKVDEPWFGEFPEQMDIDIDVDIEMEDNINDEDYTYVSDSSLFSSLPSLCGSDISTAPSVGNLPTPSPPPSPEQSPTPIPSNPRAKKPSKKGTPYTYQPPSPSTLSTFSQIYSSASPSSSTTPKPPITPVPHPRQRSTAPPPTTPSPQIIYPAPKSQIKLPIRSHFPLSPTRSRSPSPPPSPLLHPTWALTPRTPTSLSPFPPPYVSPPPAPKKETHSPAMARALRHFYAFGRCHDDGELTVTEKRLLEIQGGFFEREDGVVDDVDVDPDDLEYQSELDVDTQERSRLKGMVLLRAGEGVRIRAL